ncbi:MFS transporter [Novosphingobium cyanobacteriorum]|uniref:MFS transporter n=1 Tax=Novosphingobium cyanobacteriorum TaxID=3024215 RepID=A0ABT6CGR6_9SPHN|nr:MFS transporter [Novosphingobium cyanobacteriorum]MDF8332971.1 MFS transporter [Novosphingobium cyanobacteriorum]
MTETEALQGAHLPRERMALLFAVMLVIAAGNTAMQSVMPSIGTHLGIADVWVTLAYSWSAVVWVLIAPYWARRSDRRGRKAMMALGLTGFTLSFSLCGLALFAGLQGWVGGFMALFLFSLARLLYGTFGSAAPPAVQAYVASRTGISERTRALALISSSFGLGTVLGPALAPLLILPGIGLIGPFAGFSLFAVGVMVLIRLRLPDDTPSFAGHGDVLVAPFSAGSAPRLDGVERRLPSETPRLRWADPRIRGWLIAGALGNHAQAILLGIIGFLLLDRLGLRHQPDSAAGLIGLVLMCGAIATLLAQWGLIPALGLGPRMSTLSGRSACALGTLLVAAGNDLHSVATGFAFASLGLGLFRPGFTAGASLAASHDEQGEAAGIVTAINGSAYIVTPAIGVWLYGHTAWGVWFAVEALLIGAILTCLVAIPKDSD